MKSFENPEIAAVLNQYFVNIKVDREERPGSRFNLHVSRSSDDGQGGWPMSVFLTPDGRPFFGGTYFPPHRRYGMPSFPEILSGIVSIWQEKRSEVTEAAQQLFHRLQENTGVSLVGKGDLDPNRSRRRPRP